MLSLYMDQHVAGSISVAMRERGVDVLTAFDDELAEADDDVILARAKELRRVVFTRDRDFLAIGRAWQSSSTEFHGIVYAHQLQVTIGQAIRDLDLICHLLSEGEIRNQIFYLPL